MFSQKATSKEILEKNALRIRISLISLKKKFDEAAIANQEIQERLNKAIATETTAQSILNAISEAQQRVDEIQEEFETAQNQSQLAENALIQAQEKLSNALKELSTATIALNTVQTELDTARKLFEAEVKAEIQDENQLEQLKNNLETAQIKSASAKEKINMTERAFNMAQNALESINMSSEIPKNELNNTQIALKTAQDNLKNLKDANKNYQKDLKDAKKNTLKATENATKIKKALDKIEAAITKKNIHLTRLDNMLLASEVNNKETGAEKNVEEQAADLEASPDMPNNNSEKKISLASFKQDGPPSIHTVGDTKFNVLIKANGSIGIKKDDSNQAGLNIGPAPVAPATNFNRPQIDEAQYEDIGKAHGNGKYTFNIKEADPQNLKINTNIVVGLIEVFDREAVCEMDKEGTLTSAKLSIRSFDAKLTPYIQEALKIWSQQNPQARLVSLPQDQHGKSIYAKLSKECPLLFSDFPGVIKNNFDQKIKQEEQAAKEKAQANNTAAPNNNAATANNAAAPNNNAAPANREQQHKDQRGLPIPLQQLGLLQHYQNQLQNGQRELQQYQQRYPQLRPWDEYQEGFYHLQNKLQRDQERFLQLSPAEQADILLDYEELNQNFVQFRKKLQQDLTKASSMPFNHHANKGGFAPKNHPLSSPCNPQC